MNRRFLKREIYKILCNCLRIEDLLHIIFQYSYHLIGEPSVKLICDVSPSCPDPLSRDVYTAVCVKKYISTSQNITHSAEINTIIYSTNIDTEEKNEIYKFKEYIPITGIRKHNQLLILGSDYGNFPVFTFNLETRTLKMTKRIDMNFSSLHFSADARYFIQRNFRENLLYVYDSTKISENPKTVMLIDLRKESIIQKNTCTFEKGNHDNNYFFSYLLVEEFSLHVKKHMIFYWKVDVDGNIIKISASDFYNNVEDKELNNSNIYNVRFNYFDKKNIKEEFHKLKILEGLNIHDIENILDGFLIRTDSSLYHVEYKSQLETLYQYGKMKSSAKRELCVVS